MKTLFLLMTLLLTINAHAALTKCIYEELPCDESGNHFHCQVFAWANAEYCSPEDHTSKKFDKISGDTYEQCMEKCIQKPHADYALCDIYGCGAW
jgi:hypothetical protein